MGSLVGVKPGLSAGFKAGFVAGSGSGCARGIGSGSAIGWGSGSATVVGKFNGNACVCDLRRVAKLNNGAPIVRAGQRNIGDVPGAGLLAGTGKEGGGDVREGDAGGAEGRDGVGGDIGHCGAPGISIVGGKPGGAVTGRGGVILMGGGTGTRTGGVRAGRVITRGGISGGDGGKYG